MFTNGVRILCQWETFEPSKHNKSFQVPTMIFEPLTRREMKFGCNLFLELEANENIVFIVNQNSNNSDYLVYKMSIKVISIRFQRSTKPHIKVLSM